MENMADFFIFLRRFADDILESSAESLEHILNFITVFMGSVERCVVASPPPLPPPPCVLTHSLNFSFCSLALFGFRNRMKNPHLRAKFAEVLEAVMPHMEPIAPGAVQPVMFQRERLFCNYRHAPQLAEALITVFVDIEFTGKVIVFKVFLSFIFLAQDIYFWSSFFFSGDPHQFEQKFNYRRPMYPILKYMWAKDDYRESVKVKNPL